MPFRRQGMCSGKSYSFHLGGTTITGDRHISLLSEGVIITSIAYICDSDRILVEPIWVRAAHSYDSLRCSKDLAGVISLIQIVNGIVYRIEVSRTLAGYPFPPSVLHGQTWQQGALNSSMTNSSHCNPIIFGSE